MCFSLIDIIVCLPFCSTSVAVDVSFNLNLICTEVCDSEAN